MPQPLHLLCGGGGTLLVRHQTRTLMSGYPAGVVMEVEQVLRVLGQRCHPGVEVRALEVGHGLKMLLPYGVLLILNREKRDRQCCSSGEAVLAQGGESDVRHQLNTVSGSLPMTDPDHGSVGSKGIITLTSHWSMPWVVDSRQR
jgi:hypothetical protein